MNERLKFGSIEGGLDVRIWVLRAANQSGGFRPKGSASRGKFPILEGDTSNRPFGTCKPLSSRAGASASKTSEAVEKAYAAGADSAR